MKQLASCIALSTLFLATPALVCAAEGDSKQPPPKTDKTKTDKTKTGKKEEPKKDAPPAGGGW